jgi:CelD/BcsL family acetyltransferase involved in cellulose biosynthesis
LNVYSNETGVSVEVSRELDGPLTGAWDELAESIDAPPWCRPGWFEICLQSVAEGVPVVFCCKRRGQLVGVLPMVEGSRGLRAPANNETPDFRPLAIDSSVSKQLWTAALQPGVGIVTVLKLPGDVEFLGPMVAAAKEARFRIVSRDIHRSPYLDITDPWESFEESLSANWRQTMRRRKRQLEKGGRLDIEIADGSERFAELFDEGVRIEPSGWKREAGTALIADEKARAFYESIAKWAASKGWLRMVFLRLNGRPIAFRLDLETATTYYHLKGGYDPEFASVSPGNVLAASVIESAFRRGLKRFEFLGAAESHKLRWTQTTRELRLIRAFDRSPAGVAGFLLHKYARPIVARFRS